MHESRFSDDSGMPSGLSAPQNGEYASSQTLYIPPQRIVHLDLKGAPPMISYLKTVLTMSQSLGATGVLIEWEDMFPWSGR